MFDTQRRKALVHGPADGGRLAVDAALAVVELDPAFRGEEDLVTACLQHA